MVERALERNLDELSDDAADDVDLTLIDWFLTLSPWERLRANANWARLAALGRAETKDE